MNDALLELIVRLHLLLSVALSPVGLPEWGLIALCVLAWGWVGRVRASQGSRDPVPPLVALLILIIGWHWLFARRDSTLLPVAAPVLLAALLHRLAYRWMTAVMKDEVKISRWSWRLGVLIWGAVILEVLGLTDSVLELADSLSLPVGAHPLSLLKLVQGSLLILAALLSAIWVSRVLERRLMAVESMDISLRVVLAKLLQGGLIASAVILALPLVGIDTTFLSVVGGALGVGLGFGLQKIASNYVSGFIILLDRSIRLQDLVTVDGKKGLVSRMEARYVVVRAADGTEAIVPNETFVTGTVINHTLSDRCGALSVSWWVAHEADLRAVRALVLPLPLLGPGVLSEPAPTVQVVEVNDIGIQLKLSWWVMDLAQSDSALAADILEQVLDALRQAQVPLAKRPQALGALP